jgi:5'-methylthioadenosine phosphorylase
MLGIFGGSGFYELLENAQELDIDTPYGVPSDKLMKGTFNGQETVFLPRHGRGHKIPPHKINYRANLWAMKEAGVTKILAPSAVGSLRREIAPGTFVVCDSYIDRTRGRGDTFFDGSEVRHMSSVDPYCQNLREKIVAACNNVGVAVQDGGTMVVINGPRFSTIAESKWFSDMAHVIGMTGYPEAVLANELGICYANIALATDYDACFHNDKGLHASSAQEILAVFKQNIENVKKVVAEAARAIDMSTCPRCAEKVAQSKFN